MTDIELNTLVYDKPEIDEKLNNESARVNAILDSKIDKIEKGSPSGTATLDPIGKVSVDQLPISSSVESGDINNETTLINPKNLHYQIDIKTIKRDEIGAIGGVVPIGIDGLVDPAYLPAVRAYHTYIVEKLTDMYDLSIIGTVNLGDRCIVTSETDPLDNGEYVTDIDNPIQVNWKKIPNLSAVQTVNGKTGDVSLLSVPQSEDNRTKAIALELRVDGIDSDISNLSSADVDMQSQIDGNKTLIDENRTAITANNGRLSTLETESVAQRGDINDNKTDITNIRDFLQDPRRYENKKVTNVNVTGDIYETVAELITEERPAGKYQTTVNVSFVYNSAGRRGYIRISLDGGITWEEYSKKIDDINEVMTIPYISADDYATGIHNIIIQAKKEQSADVMTIKSANIISEYKRAEG